MTDFVIDASVAVKWVVQEAGTAQAIALRKASLAAPDLIIPECANILWKKQKLSQLTLEEASLAAQLLARADVELVAMRAQLPRAADLAIELDHPAYDCFYIVLALERSCRFVTADQRLVRKVQTCSDRPVAEAVLDLNEAASAL